MIRPALFAACSILALAACSEREEPGSLTSEMEEDGATPGDAVDISEPAEAVQAELAVTSGWVRNPPGGRQVTAGFVTITGGPARLSYVESAEAERVEMHTMAMEGDVMRMRQVEGMDVPANGALELATGGDHLMIFGLTPEAAADGELALTFTFDDGRSIQAALPFADAAPAAGAMSGDAHEGMDHGG
ncbi:MAG: copper chaperone PCu(A)C [Oceanicaulis sp.]